MSKRRRSYSSRPRDDRLPDGGIAAHMDGDTHHPGFVVLNTPYRRLFFFAGLAGVILLVIASAVAV